MNQAFKALVFAFALAVVSFTNHACTAAEARHEIVYGKLKLVYTDSGYINVHYKDVEVFRKLNAYRHNYERDKRVSYHFPLRGKACSKIKPRVVNLSDADGNRTGTMVHWDLATQECPNAALADDKPSFVRITISEQLLSIQLHVSPAYPSMKGEGYTSLLIPVESFAGGTYADLGHETTKTHEFPAEDEPFIDLGSRDGCVLTTADGVRIKVTTDYGKIGPSDYRYRSGDEKNTVRFVAGNKWHVDFTWTFEFDEPSESTGTVALKESAGKAGVE